MNISVKFVYNLVGIGKLLISKPAGENYYAV